MASAKTERMTAKCPYCGMPYTFRSESAWSDFRRKWSPRPLHAACKRQERQDRYGYDILADIVR